jgi:hypothetical protein
MHGGNEKMDFGEIVSEDVDWIQLASGSIKSVIF